jgi:hypothetical protein
MIMSTKKTKVWIARDKDGRLSLFRLKPVLNYLKMEWVPSDDETHQRADSYCEIIRELFPEITFENSPQEIEI